MRTKNFTGILTVMFLLSVSLSQPTIPVSAQADGQPEAAYTVGEGFDFATRVLSDSWDMEQFTDISQWLNNSSTYLLNIQVANGIFSATTAGSYSEFYALFPGYILGMNTGKIGAMYPIASSQFACYSMAMYSSWTAGTNYFRVDWELDRYNLFSGDQNVEVWGMSYPHYITPNTWKLYQTNLSSPPTLINDAWSSQSAWQGLRIVPSTVTNTQFSIDWIRLTDCTPVWVTFSGLPSGTYNLWIAHGSPERQILAKEAFTPAGDGTFAWDAQGVEPGPYTYYIKTTTGTLVQQGTLNVDGTPIASFNRPAPFTGIEYGTVNGNAWDIDPSDVTYIACVNYSFTNGMLFLDTLPPTQLPDGCVGPGAGEADPHIFLNTPDHGNLSGYRYVSFNMSQNGTISYPDKGMIVRIFWQLDRIGLTDCWYTSRAVPLEVGRHTYTIDMYDPRNGTPEERTPSDCPLVTWANQASVGPLVQFRLDPNENIMSWTFHQEIDWIRLNRVEAVRQGQPAEVRLLLNTPVSELTTLDLYYTTDRAQPAQHPAARYMPTTISGPFLQFIPMALRLPVPSLRDPFIDALSADVVYWWDTASVSPGTYYVCAVAGDAHTSAAYCSQAPFQIVSP
jgi:hypothetical protein